MKQIIKTCAREGGQGLSHMCRSPCLYNTPLLRTRRAPIRNLAGLINSRVWCRRHDVCRRRRRRRLTRTPCELSLTHFNRLYARYYYYNINVCAFCSSRDFRAHTLRYFILIHYIILLCAAILARFTVD